MLARLGFSVAFFTQADVILIDEVLGTGDREFQAKSMDALLSAAASERTVVLVSHQEQTLADICDSLLWLENGRVVMYDQPRTVLEKYHEYDHFILAVAQDTGRTVEAVRADPRYGNPLDTFDEMGGDAT